MGGKKILFFSGSLGLGHIARDLEIVKALREKEHGVDISWLAEYPASMVLEQAGEKLLSESKLLAHGNEKLAASTIGYDANLVRWTMNARKDWSANAQLVAKTVEREKFDLVIGDETYDIIVEMASTPRFKKFPFVMIYDFIGVDSVTHNPIEMIATYVTNRIWANAMKAKPKLAERSLFIGELDDVPDRKFGFLLPNRHKLANESVDFVGYVLSFNPSAYTDKAKVREFLGYGEEPLIVCSIGGTSAGKDLLELCAQAYSLMKKELANLRMVLVCGPLLPADSIHAPEGVEVRGYVPELYKHLAAADLCIVTGGGTITLELTALQKPFLYFPLGKHFEQQVDVASRCERHRAGVKMNYNKTSPELLAKVALENMGKEVNYEPIKTDGAQNAARIICQVLNNL